MGQECEEMKEGRSLSGYKIRTKARVCEVCQHSRKSCSGCSAKPTLKFGENLDIINSLGSCVW